MSEPKLPQPREELVQELTSKAASLWGQERAKALQEIISEHADHLIALSKTLPYFEEVPTLTWQNHP